MKIAFVCSSLEPGRDGVGDYARHLASQCEKAGHTVCMVGLHDRWLTGQVPQVDGSQCRLPASIPWRDRIQWVNRQLKEWQPDLLSFQFVAFGLDDRGILGKKLDDLYRDAPWHFMFHELWVGAVGPRSFKYRVWGWVQRYWVLRLVGRLAPTILHTHAEPYRQELLKAGLAAKSLPLFANIDIAERPDFDWIYEKLADHLTQKTRSKARILVFFGSLHPEWEPEELLRKIKSTNVIFLALGRMGEAGQVRWQSFAEQLASQATFLSWGEMSAERISAVLQFADAGVAVSPWGLIEKSGSAAAMIEHGLPVIVTRRDIDFPAGLRPSALWDQRLFPIWAEDFSWEKLQRISPQSALPGIARKFLEDLPS